MLKKTISINKPIGMTPLEAVNRFRAAYPDYSNAKIAYAGRLDPQASGLLLLLVNDECKHRDKYQDLDKTYDFQVLFGVSTDTADIMGMPSRLQSPTDVSPKQIFATIKQQLEDVPKPLQIDLPYPAYSSKAVDGKPLFEWAREGRLAQIIIPTKTSSIFELTVNDLTAISTTDLLSKVRQRVSMVNGDFRQAHIQQEWAKLLTQTQIIKWNIIDCTVKASSGTYVRSLCEYMGSLVNLPALAYNITRTKLGEFDINNATLLSTP